MISRIGGQLIGYVIKWSAPDWASSTKRIHLTQLLRLLAEVLLRLRREPGFSARHLGVQLPSADGSVSRSHLCLDRRIPLRGEFKQPVESGFTQLQWKSGSRVTFWSDTLSDERLPLNGAFSSPSLLSVTRGAIFFSACRGSGDGRMGLCSTMKTGMQQPLLTSTSVCSSTLKVGRTIWTSGRDVG